MKLKQVEFALGSEKFLILSDAFEPNKPSTVKVYDFKEWLDFKFENP